MARSLVIIANKKVKRFIEKDLSKSLKTSTIVVSILNQTPSFLIKNLERVR